MKKNACHGDEQTKEVVAAECHHNGAVAGRTVVIPGRMDEGGIPVDEVVVAAGPGKMGEKHAELASVGVDRVVQAASQYRHGQSLGMMTPREWDQGERPHDCTAIGVEAQHLAQLVYLDAAHHSHSNPRLC